MQLLPDAIPHDSPYRFAFSRAALGTPACEALARLFDEDVPWARHDASFYACFLAVVTDRVDPALLAALPPRMGELLGLPLTTKVHVTIQRMEPGDHALVHTDRPLAGYESARLVVQLNPDWRADDAGLLEVHATDRGDDVCHSLAPRWDHAFAFAMTPGSHHAVTPAIRPRRSAVFNFWHVGNTDEVAELVRSTFDGLRFDALPRQLDPVIAAAEATLPEDLTHRAGLIALVLTRWGYDAEEVGRAYTRALDPGPAPAWPLGDHEEDMALTLAAWLAELHLDHFDLERWATLSAVLDGRDPSAWPRLSAVWARTFPRLARANDAPRGLPAR